MLDGGGFGGLWVKGLKRTSAMETDQANKGRHMTSMLRRLPPARRGRSPNKTETLRQAVRPRRTVDA